MANLFDLNQNELQILEMLENEEIDFNSVKDTLDSINDERNHKYDSIQKMILSLKGDVNTLKEREAALNKRRRSFESKIKSLQNYLLESMKFTDTKKLKTEEFTYFIRKSKSTEIIDEKVIPEKYLIKQPQKVDRKAIGDDIKNGIDVPGAVIVENETLGVR